MRVLVLGAGQQGSACAYDLLTRTDAEVFLADRVTDHLPGFLRDLGDRLHPLPLDASDHEAAVAAMRGMDVVCCALPYYLNYPMAAAAIEAGAHFCDLGGNTAIVQQQQALAARAREREVSVVADCGVAPGMVNVLAAAGIRRLERPRAVRMMVGGLPQHPEPPLHYQVVYSLEGVLDYYTTPAMVLRDGEIGEVEALSDVVEVDLPGVGRLEAFHTAGGLSTMASRYAGVLDAMEYRTLRYPGHAVVMRAIRDLGLLDREPVQVGAARVTPRDLFLVVAGPRLLRDPRESPDMVALRVEVEGERGGRSLRLRWDLLDRFDPDTGITAMMRTTGFSLAVTAALLGEGSVEPGVWTSDEAIPADHYVSALRERGLEIRFTEHSI